MVWIVVCVCCSCATNWCWVLFTAFSTCLFVSKIVSGVLIGYSYWCRASYSLVTRLRTMFAWCIPSSFTVKSLVSHILWCAIQKTVWTIPTSSGLSACGSTRKFPTQTWLSCEWSRSKCSRLDVRCRRFRWCRKTQEVLQWQKMRSQSGLEDGVLSF